MEAPSTLSEQFKEAEHEGALIVPDSLPRTVVLSISTHGNIILGKPSFDVHPDITLVKMNSVIPSVCNFVLEENLQKVNDIITKEILRLPNLNSTNLLTFCSEIRENVIKESKETVDSIFTDVSTKKRTGETEDLDIQMPFLHSYDRGYAIINGTGSTMTNKKYSRTNADAINKFGDWQIKILNIEGQPDIMIDVERACGRRSSPSGEAVVYLSEVIDFCASKGTRRFLIFDFSCANVTDEDNDDVFTNERDRRKFANDMLKNGKWGGKTIKSEKTIKSGKSKRQWRKKRKLKKNKTKKRKH
jgi:hypothetical protein